MISNNFVLKPKYEISNIRPDSPADFVDLRIGDILLQEDRINAYKYKLSDLNNLFSSEKSKRLR